MIAGHTEMIKGLIPMELFPASALREGNLRESLCAGTPHCRLFRCAGRHWKYAATSFVAEGHFDVHEFPPLSE